MEFHGKTQTINHLNTGLNADQSGEIQRGSSAGMMGWMSLAFMMDLMQPPRAVLALKSPTVNSSTFLTVYIMDSHLKLIFKERKHLKYNMLLLTMLGDSIHL